MRLSQGQLNLLSTCPRKFQHTYLEQLASPTTPDQQEKLIWGSRFHLLMQQYQMGLPVEPLVQEDPQLQRWFAAFVQAEAEILQLAPIGSQVTYQSEHTRSLEFAGYWLTGVYDLLLTNADRGKILDWKTYPRPQSPRWILQNWQTRLYLFLLAETSDYPPDRISMVYWFFQSAGAQAEVAEAQHLSVSYTTTQHEQTRRDLTHLLNQLTDWLARYDRGEPFPQFPVRQRECEHCSFAVRCEVDGLQDSEAQWRDLASLSIAAIPEVPL